MNYVKLLEEKKTARMTVYLQPFLLREMREAKLSGINWSAVARGAFIKKIKELQKAAGKDP
jgi:hypothetical protein